MINRGLPTKLNFSFRLGDIDNIEELDIVFSQNETTILKKSKEDIEFGCNKISVILSAEDTFKFRANVNLHMQIFIKYINNELPIVSKPIIADVENPLERE